MNPESGTPPGGVAVPAQAREAKASRATSGIDRRIIYGMRAIVARLVMRQFRGSH